MEEKIKNLVEKIEKIANIKVEEAKEQIDRIVFKLDDNLTRGEVEAITTTLNFNNIPAKPFGVPYRRGFHIKKIYLV
jgi:predicted nucleic acid-binding protein